jgi:hypothetical protein
MDVEQLAKIIVLLAIGYIIFAIMTGSGDKLLSLTDKLREALLFR